MRSNLAAALIVSSSVLAVGLARGGADPPSTAEVRHLNLPSHDPALPFTHVVEVGDTVYLAGTLGIDVETGSPPADPVEEARLALDGIRAKLALADLTMDDLVSVQVFCSDLELYGPFNDLYRTYFDERFPVRAFVGSGPLLRGCRFEIQGTAARP